MFRFFPLLVCFLLSTSPVFTQEEETPWGDSLPDQIRRPQRGNEMPRYPEDVVIGILGKGEASEESYRFARRVLDALLRGNRESSALSNVGPAWMGEITVTLEQVSPVKYRIGNGREEADGSTSFLFRFLGREQGIAGELYVRPEKNEEGTITAWRFDDILLEDPHDTTQRIDPYSYDFTPYERFF